MKKNKYPNRLATMINNSHYLAQIKDESMIELSNQQDRINKQNMKETLIQHATHNTNTTNIVNNYNTTEPTNVTAQTTDTTEFKNKFDEPIITKHRQIINIRYANRQ